jgi:hypothetical protein
VEGSAICDSYPTVMNRYVSLAATSRRDIYSFPCGYVRHIPIRHILLTSTISIVPTSAITRITSQTFSLKSNDKRRLQTNLLIKRSIKYCITPTVYQIYPLHYEDILNSYIYVRTRIFTTSISWFIGVYGRSVGFGPS